MSELNQYDYDVLVKKANNFDIVMNLTCPVCKNKVINFCTCSDIVEKIREKKRWCSTCKGCDNENGRIYQALREILGDKQ